MLKNGQAVKPLGFSGAIYKIEQEDYWMFYLLS